MNRACVFYFFCLLRFVAVVCIGDADLELGVGLSGNLYIRVFRTCQCLRYRPTPLAPPQNQFQNPEQNCDLAPLVSNMSVNIIVDLNI